MLDNDDLLEDAIRDLIVDICAVLYERGYNEVPIGALMRLVGVDVSKAESHDNEYFILDDEFRALLDLDNKEILQQAPPGVTLH